MCSQSIPMAFVPNYVGCHSGIYPEWPSPNSEVGDVNVESLGTATCAAAEVNAHSGK